MTVINFIPVSTPQAKMEALCQTARRCLHNQQRLLFLVKNLSAAEYLDRLLWKLPPEGFLPHMISDATCDSPIVISHVEANYNQAKVLFNLRPEPSALAKDFSEVYELMDKSDGNKLALSQAKHQAYKENGFQIRL